MTSLPATGPNLTGADTPPFVPSAEQAGELIIHRPRAMSGGAARSFKFHLDGRHVADLRAGSTACVRACAGHHELEVRCWPHARVRLTLDLAPHQTFRVRSYLSPLRELEMCLDNDFTAQVPTP